MELTLENGTTFRNPTAADIEAALASLDNDGNSFAILKASEMTYLQTAGGAAAGFVLEYQDGTTDAHFQARGGKHPLRDVQTAFERFAAGDPAWKSTFAWEPLDITRNRRGCMGSAALLFVELAAVGGWMASR